MVNHQFPLCSWGLFGITSTCCRAISLSTTELKPVRILELQPNDFIDMFINLPYWMYILPELSRSLWARAKRIVVPQSINWHAIRKTDFFSGRAIYLGRNTCFMTHWKDKRFTKQTGLTHLKCNRYSSPQDLRLQVTCVVTDSFECVFPRSEKERIVIP